MIDPYVLLNVSPGATQDEIRRAYYQKRAQLTAQEADDPTVPEQLADLETAYSQLTERFRMVPVAQQRQDKPVDPMLNLVDSLDTPIRMQATVGAMKPCPTCGALNPEKAMICQACGFQIAKTCPNCGEVVARDMADCPRCGTLIKELHQTRLAEAEVAKDRTLRERDSNDLRVNALEAEHTERRKFGLLFWAIVGLVLLGLCALVVFAPVLMAAFLGQR